MKIISKSIFNVSSNLVYISLESPHQDSNNITIYSIAIFRSLYSKLNSEYYTRIWLVDRIFMCPSGKGIITEIVNKYKISVNLKYELI